MAPSKYKDLIVPAPIAQSKYFPQIKAPQINVFGGDHLHGINFTMNWSYSNRAFARYLKKVLPEKK